MNTKKGMRLLMPHGRVEATTSDELVTVEDPTPDLETGDVIHISLRSRVRHLPDSFTAVVVDVQESSFRCRILSESEEESFWAGDEA